MTGSKRKFLACGVALLTTGAMLFTATISQAWLRVALPPGGALSQMMPKEQWESRGWNKSKKGDFVEYKMNRGSMIERREVMEVKDREVVVKVTQTYTGNNYKRETNYTYQFKTDVTAPKEDRTSTTGKISLEGMEVTAKIETLTITSRVGGGRVVISSSGAVPSSGPTLPSTVPVPSKGPAAGTPGVKEIKQVYTEWYVAEVPLGGLVKKTGPGDNIQMELSKWDRGR